MQRVYGAVNRSICNSKNSKNYQSEISSKALSFNHMYMSSALLVDLCYVNWLPVSIYILSLDRHTQFVQALTRHVIISMTNYMNVLHIQTFL